MSAYTAPNFHIRHRPPNYIDCWVTPIGTGDSSLDHGEFCVVDQDAEGVWIETDGDDVFLAWGEFEVGDQ